MERNYKAGNT